MATRLLAKLGGPGSGGCEAGNLESLLDHRPVRVGRGRGRRGSSRPSHTVDSRTSVGDGETIEGGRGGAAFRAVKRCAGRRGRPGGTAVGDRRKAGRGGGWERRRREGGAFVRHKRKLSDEEEEYEDNQQPHKRNLVRANTRGSVSKESSAEIETSVAGVPSESKNAESVAPGELMPENLPKGKKYSRKNAKVPGNIDNQLKSDCASRSARETDETYSASSLEKGGTNLREIRAEKERSQPAGTEKENSLATHSAIQLSETDPQFKTNAERSSLKAEEQSSEPGNTLELVNESTCDELSSETRPASSEKRKVNLTSDDVTAVKIRTPASACQVSKKVEENFDNDTRSDSPSSALPKEKTEELSTPKTDTVNPESSTSIPTDTYKSANETAVSISTTMISATSLAEAVTSESAEPKLNVDDKSSHSSSNTSCDKESATPSSIPPASSTFRPESPEH